MASSSTLDVKACTGALTLLIAALSIVDIDATDIDARGSLRVEASCERSLSSANAA
jgi:hypothetical protein